MPNPVITRAIDALSSRRDLSAEQTGEVLAEIMDGNASEVETAGFLIALRTKGETVAEIEGLARTMRRFATPVDAGRGDLVDTAGTGGGRPTFNVSTTAALIAAGAGCAVAKHGNRSATGLSGSADVLEALGVRIDLAPDAVARCIREVGFGFMFAPAHHSATRYVVPVRKELAVRTIFNFLGPLTNPAGATAAGDRCLGPRLPGDDRGRAGPPGRRTGAGSVKFRRSGRDEHVGDNARRRGRRRGAAPLRGVPGGRRAGARRAGRHERRPPRDQRRHHPPDLRRRARSRARHRAAQRRRRDLRLRAGRRPLERRRRGRRGGRLGRRRGDTRRADRPYRHTVAADDRPGSHRRRHPWRGRAPP